MPGQAGLFLRVCLLEEKTRRAPGQAGKIRFSTVRKKARVRAYSQLLVYNQSRLTSGRRGRRMRRFWDEGIWSREVPGPGYNKAIFTAASFAHAQPHCNFVVLEPRRLPDGCTLGPISTRTEAERWSTVHFRVLGKNRRLRVKQFLYDWWTLTVSSTNLVTVGRPFRAGPTIGWHGTDYKGLPAACWAKLRTQVEISVEEGRFDPEELELLCAGMEAADADAAAQIWPVPFARISFTVRRHRGPWGMDRIAGCTWSDSLPQAVHACAMPVLVPGSLPPGFAYDSAGWRRSRKGMGGEWQLVLRHTGNWTDTIHLRGTQPGSSDPVGVPPGPEVRKAYQWTALDLRGNTFHFGVTLARPDGRLQPSPFGGWAALWVEAGVQWECYARASAALSAEGFRQFILALRTEFPQVA